MKDFKKGDPPPTTYNAWHEWAGVQYKAGLRQVSCGICGLFKFPQELSETVIKHNLGESLVCLECVKD